MFPPEIVTLAVIAVVLLVMVIALELVVTFAAFTYTFDVIETLPPTTLVANEFKDTVEFTTSTLAVDRTVVPMKIAFDETVRLAAAATVPPRKAVGATNVSAPNIPVTNPLPVVVAPDVEELAVTISLERASNTMLVLEIHPAKVSVAIVTLATGLDIVF